MTTYVVDDLVLTAGLADLGQEHHRRELSRLLHDAMAGGPGVDVPACCLVAAAVVRPALADHVADLMAAAPPGAINICGLSRILRLDSVRRFHRDHTWPTAHAAVHALTARLPLVTIEPMRYAGLGLDVMTL